MAFAGVDEAHDADGIQHWSIGGGAGGDARGERERDDARLRNGSAAVFVEKVGLVLGIDYYRIGGLRQLGIGSGTPGEAIGAFLGLGDIVERDAQGTVLSERDDTGGGITGGGAEEVIGEEDL